MQAALLAMILAQPAAPTVVAIHPARVLVRGWEGFGCSLSWWGVFTSGWPDQSRKEVCRRLFGRGDDCLGWNVVRYNAGGTSPDADPKRFRPGGKVQVTLDADGSFHPERDVGQMTCLSEAKRQGAGVFELFANSPPHWMLRSGDTHGGANGHENLKPECEGEFAKWLATVATKVESAAGVRFRSIAPFNEPSAGWWKADGAGQEGCKVLPPAQARILRALRAELGHMGRRAIVAASDENDAHTAYETLKWLTDPAAGGLKPGDVGRLNVHSYWGWEWQERVRDLAAERRIPRVWMSEVSFREWENAGYVPDDMRCALPQTRAVVNDLKRLRPSAWVFWQAVEPLQFCVWYRFTYGLLQAAADSSVEWRTRTYQPGEFVVSKAFWALMQFSRFIRPGYRFVECSDFWTVVALAPDGKHLVIVTHNDGDSPRQLAFDLARWRRSVSSVRAWRTMDDIEGVRWNCRATPTLRVNEGRFTDTVPARSVTTYVVTATVRSRSGPGVSRRLTGSRRQALATSGTCS